MNINFSIFKWMLYKLKRTKLSTYPDRLYVESTNQCNLKCVMCPNGMNLMKRKRGFIDYNLFRNIIDEMAPHVKTFVLHIWGEPLLHPRIFDMISYCHNSNAITEISTNATLLDNRFSKKILDIGLDVIYLCLDGATKETYENIRRASSFEKTLQNIQNFLKLKNETQSRKPFVNLQIIMMKNTQSEIAKFKEIWSIPGVDNINVKAFDSWGNRIPEISNLGVNIIKTPEKHFPCPNLWFHAHIYWDGTLVCCDRDFDAEYPLGNVSNGVMNAWNGDRMVELRKKHVLNKLGDAPSCRSCIEWCWWKPTPFRSFGNIPQRSVI